MSPVFNYNPSNVVSSFEVFPKDDYELIVGEPKPFSGQNQAGNDSFGIRFSLTIGAGDYEKKRTVASFYLHSEGAQSMTKQFQMAVLGYGKGRAEEQRFDAEWGHKDWSVDFDNKTTGDAWREMVGQRVIGSLDVGINTNTGDQQQNFKGWRKLGS